MLTNNNNNNATDEIEESSSLISGWKLQSLVRTYQQQPQHQQLVPILLDGNHDDDNNIMSRRMQLVKINGSFTFAFRDFVAPPIATDLSGTARFGYSSDFADAFGTQSEQRSYVLGLMWLGVIVAIIFFIWFIIIIFLYMLGSKRVGFLSGSPLRHLPSSTGSENDPKQQQQHGTRELYDNDNSTANDEQGSKVKSVNNNGDTTDFNEANNVNNTDLDNVDNTHQHNLFNSQATDGIEEANPNKDNFENSQPESFRRNENTTTRRQRCSCLGIHQSTWIRGVFILSGIIVILFSILFVTLGLSNFQEAVETVNTAALTSNNITTSASTLIETDAIAVQEQAAPLIDDLNTAIADEVNCPNSTNATQADMAIQFLNATAKVVSSLQAIGQYIESNQIGSLLETLDAAKQMSQGIYDTTDQIDVTSWQSVAVLVLFTLVPFGLVISAVMSAQNRVYPIYHRLVVWFIFPLFFILIIITALFCALSIISASSNSDFCYPQQYKTDPNSLLPPGRQNVTMNSPDVSALQIMQNVGISIDSSEYKIAAFYITQCFVTNPLSSLESYALDLQLAKENLKVMIESLNSTEVMSELTTVCGGSYDKLNQTIGQVQSFIVELSNYINDLLSLIKCDNIVPIYQATFYDAGCGESLKAMTWMFASSFIVAAFGFLMITLRAAYSRTIYDTSNSFGTYRSHVNENDALYNDHQNIPDAFPEQDARDNSTSFQDERHGLDPSERPNEVVVESKVVGDEFDKILQQMNLNDDGKQ